MWDAGRDEGCRERSGMQGGIQDKGEAMEERI